MNPVDRYFNEEKAGSYLFIIKGVIALAITLCLIFTLKTSFWKGFALPLALVAALELAGGLTIVLRSQKDIARVAFYTE